jgi:hypothetical protein
VVSGHILIHAHYSPTIVLKVAHKQNTTQAGAHTQHTYSPCVPLRSLAVFVSRIQSNCEYPGPRETLPRPFTNFLLLTSFLLSLLALLLQLSELLSYELLLVNSRTGVSIVWWCLVEFVVCVIGVYARIVREPRSGDNREKAAHTQAWPLFLHLSQVCLCTCNSNRNVHVH